MSWVLIGRELRRRGLPWMAMYIQAVPIQPVLWGDWGSANDSAS